MSDNSRHVCFHCRYTLRACSCDDICFNCSKKYSEHIHRRWELYDDPDENGRVKLIKQGPMRLWCPTQYKVKILQTSKVRRKKRCLEN
jgi:hypothetical protein